jgi:hypothetical protein
MPRHAANLSWPDQGVFLITSSAVWAAGSAAIHSSPACQYAASRGTPSPAASISQASQHRFAVSSDIPVSMSA